MCGGCNTSSSTTAANPGAQAAYTDVVGKAQQVAGTAYQPYTGELVAGLNGGQSTAINQLAGAYGTAQPYFRQASGDLNQAGQGLGNVQQYLQASSDATAGVEGDQAAAGNEFGQSNTLVGQSSGALGGVAGYQNLAQGAYGQAQGYAGQAAGAYGQEQAGLGQVGQYLGAANGYFGQAASLATPQDFNGADGVSKYENPYTQDVINTTMAQLNQNDQVQATNIASNAIGSGAYGGDRNGIAQAALAGQQDLANNQTVAGLNQANFGQATNEFNAVQGQRQAGAGIYSNLGQGELQAGGLQLSDAQGYGQVGSGFTGLGSLANATGAGYTGLGQLQGQTAQEYGNLASTSTGIGSGYNSTGQLGLGTAGAYGTLGQLQGTTAQAYGTLGGQASALGQANQSTLVSGASAGLQGATLQQQNQQQQDTALYNQYMAGLSYPYQNVGFLSNIVQGIGSQEGNTQTTQGNALSSIAGLGTSSIGILGATGAFGANGYLSGLGSAASGALSFSDARVKENIAPVGQTFDGQTLHRYNYKGEDPARPQIGLIAQEVAQRDPGAVGDMGGGLMGVNYDRATAGAAKMGLGSVGRFAATQGADLASRMAKATGGPVMGAAPVGLGSVAMMRPGAPMGLGAPSPVAQPQGIGLAARPHFDGGGAVDPMTGVPIPSGGLNTSPAALMGSGGGLNLSPSALTFGAPTAHAPQMSGGMRSPLMTGPPTSPMFAGTPAPEQPTGLGAVGGFSGGSGGSGGLGAPISFNSDGASATPAAPASGTSGGGLGGVSQNAWMGVLAAGLGMMGGHSASAANNIGAGGLAGLQTYLGLQQQDKGNAVQQQELALRKQQADQTASYQSASLGLDQKKVDLSVKQLEAEISNQQRNASNQSAQLANQTASTNSEVAARNVATAAARYSRTFIPGQGWMVTDLTDPTKPPQMVPMAAQGAPPPQATAPMTTPAAAPPQSGVAAPAAPPVNGFNTTIPGSAAPVPALAAAQPRAAMPGASVPNAAPSLAGAPPVGAPPQAGSPPPPSGLGAGWKPTTAVPQGFVPPNQTGIYMNPGVLKGEQENAAKTIEATRGESQAAGGLQMRLDEMDRQFAQLPQTGLMAPGAGAEARANIAKTANQYAVGLGIQPIFDPNAVAANENLLKDRFRLGADLAKSMGGREPGYIVQQAVKANPGADNTPQAYQRITAGLRQAAQYQQDRASFFDDYNAKFGHLNGAQQAFDQANPPQAYANRAVVSTIDPRDVSALQQNAKNPAAAAAIDRKYGVGASTAIMGQ